MPMRYKNLAQIIIIIIVSLANANEQQRDHVAEKRRGNFRGRFILIIAILLILL